MSLASLIHQLTEEHLTFGPDHKPIKRAPLLLELQAAVTPGPGTGDGGKSGPPLPINADALELEMRIRREAHDDHQAMRGWDHRGPVRDVITSYLDETHEVRPNDEWEAYLEHVMLEWVDAINQLVDPPKPRRKLHVECPACGQMFHGDEAAPAVTANCWGKDEQMLPPGDWDVTCDACGAAWSGDNLRYFLAAITQHAA